MSCCGKMRLSKTPPGSHLSAAQAAGPVQASRQSRVFFEYLGRTALTVVGPVSGRRYRFDRPGARLEVDLKDRRSLAALPLLRQMAPGAG